MRTITSLGKRIRGQALTLLATAVVLGTCNARAAPLRVEYLHDLSDSTGPVGTTGATLVYDHRSNEVIVIEQGIVRLFNDAGMEIHSFGRDERLHGVVYVAPLDEESGDYLLLRMKGDGGFELLRVDFRGDPVDAISLSGLPGGLERFRPNVVAVVGNRIYLGDTGERLIVTTDADGSYTGHVDLTHYLKPLDETEKVVEPDVRGLQFDSEGNALFTSPSLFRAFSISPRGEVKSWGIKGSTPGRFNVVVAVTRDSDGYFYVVDILRCVVSIWTPELRFMSQFGRRGTRPGTLVTPGSIVAGNGKIFVSLGRGRGVAVFKAAGEGA